MPPPPHRLFRLYDDGKLSREEFHAAMRVHAEALIAEMEEDRLNPLAAALEGIKSRYAAAKLTRHHNEEDIRAVFAALAELDDFPPALHLWNALHKHVPLRCFLRPGREPVFRVLDLASGSRSVRVTVEYGSSAKRQAIREEVTFIRSLNTGLLLEKRTRLA